MDDDALWVFGYGSLLWNPGFDYDRRELATLPGYSRSFCMWSIHHRGTETQPGLVLALDPHADGSCDGLAFRVPPRNRGAVLDYLRDRELISSAYLERFLPLVLANGQRVEAVVYVVDTDHAQYVRDMPLEQQAQVIARAVGGRGPNTEYLYNTQAHLEELAIEDADLRWLAARVRALVE